MAAAAALSPSNCPSSAEKACIRVSGPAVLPTDAEDTRVAAVADGVAKATLVLGSRGAAVDLLDA